MDDGDPAGGVGVRVVLARPAMRRPASMADADGAVDRVLVEHRREIGELALGPAAFDRAVDQRGDASGIVARSAEHTSELQSLMRLSYAVFCLDKIRSNSPLNSPSLDTSHIT